MTNEVDLHSLKANPGVLRLYSSRVKLDKQGRDYFAQCPFHSEKSGSFTVSKSQQGEWLYHCFGCSEGGDIFKFIQKMDKIDFKAAIEKVQEFVGETSNRVDQVFKPIEPAAKEYKVFTRAQFAKLETALADSEAGKNWLLKERGITYETAKKLHLGYRQDLAEIAGPKGEDIKDKGWIALPCIRDGVVVSIEYRSIAKKDFRRQPQMVTELFGLDEIDPFTPVWLVEGKIDQLALTQAGFSAVSLPSAGFVLTPAMRDAVLSAEYVVLAGDNDETGATAMDRLQADFGDRAVRVRWPSGNKDANETFLKECKGDLLRFTELCDTLLYEAKSQPMKGVYSLTDTLRKSVQGVTADNPSRFHWPWATVDKMANFLPGDVALVTATDTGMGKALANGTGVLTPSGFVAIETLRAEDYVIGSDGKPTKVRGVFPQGEKDAYEVQLNDYSTIVCCEDHLWTAQTSWEKYTKQPAKVRSLKDMVKRGFKHPYYLPTLSPVNFAPSPELSIHPYILGCILGDGSTCGGGVQITSKDPQILKEIEKHLHPSLVVNKRKNPIQYGICRKARGGRNYMRTCLSELGILGHKSQDKLVPDVYKFSSIEDRIALLQGLLDTDGNAPENNGIEFTTTSSQLIEDFMFIVKSLGGTGRVRPRKSRKKGKKHIEYNVRIRFFSDVKPFRLDRKAAKLRPRRTFIPRAIVGAKKIGTKEMTCISVAAADGLFVAEDFIVTHNTQFILQATVDASRKYPEVVLNYQGELSPEEIANIVAANVLAKDRNTLTQEDYVRAAKVLGSLRYYIGADPNLTTANPVLDLIEEAVIRFGVTILVIDHIHFICRNSSNEIQEQANAMQRIKNMARKYGLKVIVVAQPRKADQKNEGKERQLNAVKGSEALVSDSSIVYFIHRDVVKNIDPANPPMDDYEPVATIRNKKARSKGTGVAYARLFFHGAIATFSEMVADDSLPLTDL